MCRIYEAFNHKMPFDKTSHYLISNVQSSWKCCCTALLYVFHRQVTICTTQTASALSETGVKRYVIATQSVNTQVGASCPCFLGY